MIDDNIVKVSRAIFLAAGFGARLVPVSINTPKPLVRVNGVRIIDTLLDAVYSAGIEDVHIVRGYLGEQFDQLLYKYPKIKFIENPYYNEANNISSVYLARELLANAYVIESDLLLKNPNLITACQSTSNYLGVPTEHTDDWCFETNADGVITKVKVGGDNCHHMFGISYWSENDGVKLAKHVEQAYNAPDGKNLYWDEVALKLFIDEYKIKVRECTFDDIVEIDTFKELQDIDERYRINI